MKKPQPKSTVPLSMTSGNEPILFTWDEPTGQTPYTFRLEGTYYGQRWAANITREGLRHLMLKMMEAL